MHSILDKHVSIAFNRESMSRQLWDKQCVSTLYEDRLARHLAKTDQQLNHFPFVRTKTITKTLNKAWNRSVHMWCWHELRAIFFPDTYWMLEGSINAHRWVISLAILFRFLKLNIFIRMSRIGDLQPNIEPKTTSTSYEWYVVRAAYKN